MSSPARQVWLSLTPEPERDLPAAIATLRAGGAPGSARIRAERERAESLVLRGSRRRWLAWLREGLELAEATPDGDPELESARELVLDVIANHHALELGLPGRRAPSTGRDGALLERAKTGTRKGAS